MLATSQKQFNPIYWAHWHPSIAALALLDQGIARQTRALDLAKKGFIIDKSIMSDGWDPYDTMSDRIQDGYPWIPNILQPPLTLAPGVTPFPGAFPQSKKRPANAIKVSLDLKDYAPFSRPPAPPVLPPPSLSLVGLDLGGGTYSVPSPAAVIAAGLHDGSIYLDPAYVTHPSRGKFLLHESASPFAAGTNEIVMWWTPYLGANSQAMSIG